MLLEKEVLKQEIQQCCDELKDANVEFNLVDDPDMIDSCIFKISSLERKHASLLKRYKAAM